MLTCEISVFGTHELQTSNFLCKNQNSGLSFGGQGLPRWQRKISGLEGLAMHKHIKFKIIKHKTLTIKTNPMAICIIF